jgi:hypothetical protein
MNLLQLLFIYIIILLYELYIVNNFVQLLLLNILNFSQNNHNILLLLMYLFGCYLLIFHYLNFIHSILCTNFNIN